MAEKPIADTILDEARGAHGTSRQILELMQAPSDDPIAVMLGLLQGIQSAQRSILARLESIERRLASDG